MTGKSRGRQKPSTQRDLSPQTHDLEITSLVLYHCTTKTSLLVFASLSCFYHFRSASTASGGHWSNQGALQRGVSVRMPGSRVPPACHHQLEDQYQPVHRQHGRGNRQRDREGAGKLISSGHFEPSLLFFCVF